MKSRVFSLVCLLLLFTPVRSETTGVTPQNEDVAGTVQGRLGWSRPATVWNRNQDSQDLPPWQILRQRRLGMGPRPLSSTFSGTSSSGARIANPIFFLPPTYATGGANAANLVVGDFNGDGKRDLVVANACVTSQNCSHGTLDLLLGNGDGTFQRPVQVAGFNGFMAVGDFNRDGRMDLAVAPCSRAGCESFSVDVLLGNADGTFRRGPTFSFPKGIFAFAMAAGDFNGDGEPDFVVAHCDTSCQAFSADVFLGKGDGTFQPAVSSSLQEEPDSIAVGDFNHDGKMDLAVSSYIAGRVSIFLGEGDGSLHPSVSYRINGSRATTIVVGDFNGDNNPDLAVSDEVPPNCTDTLEGAVDVFLGKGDGTFRHPVTFCSQEPSFFAGEVAAGDFNGDGKLDLLVVNDCPVAFCDTSTISLLLGNGKGGFHLGTVYGTDGTTATMAAGDFNGDGKPDLAVMGCPNDFCIHNSVLVLLGNGSGFQGPVSYASPDGASSVAVGDFNRDGKPDLALANQCADIFCTGGSVSMLLNHGNGSFQVAKSYASGGLFATAVAVGDFNGDGKLDLAVANECADSSCTNGSVGVLLGNGNATFQTAVSYSSGGVNSPVGLFPGALRVGDVNGDGKPDLVVVNECADSSCANGSVSVLLGNGNGTFQPPVSYSSGGFGAASVAVADFNRDGKPDLVVANQCAGSFPCPNGSVSVLLGNGNGTFQPPVSYPSGDSDAFSVAVADFNGDGKLDLAVSNDPDCGSSCNGSVGVLLGNGDGSFQPAVTYSSGLEFLSFSSASSVVVADLDGDGKLDLVLSTRRVLRGNGDGSFRQVEDYNPGQTSGAAAVLADFNADGKPDLAVTGGRESLVTVLLNRAAGFHYATSAAVASSINPASLRQIVKFTATVTPAFAGPAITGTVTFSDGGRALASVPVSNGQAAFATSSLALGAHAITATYHGDENFLPSKPAALTETIAKDATGTSLTSSSNPSSVGQLVSFTARVSGQFGGVPTGSVTFRDGTTALATVSLSGGQRKFSTSALSAGKHMITASYGGDAHFLPSTSTKLVQVVNGAASSARLRAPRDP